MIAPDTRQQFSRYGYTNQEKELGLKCKKEIYNYRAREYDPTLRKFLSPDKAKQQYGAYTYVANNPVSFVDRDGNEYTKEEMMEIFKDIMKESKANFKWGAGNMFIDMVNSDFESRARLSIYRELQEKLRPSDAQNYWLLKYIRGGNCDEMTRFTYYTTILKFAELNNFEKYNNLQLLATLVGEPGGFVHFFARVDAFGQSKLVPTLNASGEPTLVNQLVYNKLRWQRILDIWPTEQTFAYSGTLLHKKDKLTTRIIKKFDLTEVNVLQFKKEINSTEKIVKEFLDKHFYSQGGLENLIRDEKEKHKTIFMNKLENQKLGGPDLFAKSYSYDYYPENLKELEKAEKQKQENACQQKLK